MPITKNMIKPKLTLSIQFASQSTHPDRAEFRRWAKAAIQTDVMATLRIVDAEEGLNLNQDYRGKNYATNVLTFEYGQVPGEDPESGMLMGDIVLCAPVVEREAREQGKELAAHYAHLTVHGMLHLQGYDHETNEANAIAMEAIESFIMQGLGFPHPYQ
jgi:probable rRNA maturation factor